jgi:hypothetical protein
MSQPNAAGPSDVNAPRSESGVPPRATRRGWIGLGVLTRAALVYAMDLTVLNLAIPRLSEALRPSIVKLLWIIDIYGFLVAGLLITMGTLGDRIGRRKLLLGGAAGFALASFFAAFSQSSEMLIISRAVMGIAGATVAPSTVSLIFPRFRDPRHPRRLVSGSLRLEFHDEAHGQTRLEVRQWLPEHLASPSENGWSEAFTKLDALLPPERRRREQPLGRQESDRVGPPCRLPSRV